jgi:carboxypeptidase Q
MKKASLLAAALLLVLAPLTAQEDIDQRIRDEVNQRSQIMRTLHFLTDVYGPRVTGSPSLKAAGEWAIATMAEWGLTNGRMEPWDFGHAGWVNERFTAHILSPVKDQLTAEVLAWTPGTPAGAIRAQAFHLVPPPRATADQLDAYFSSVKEAVKGRIVLAGEAVPAPVNLTPSARRRDDEQVRNLFDPERGGGRGGSGRGGAGGRGGGAQTTPPPMAPGEISRRIDDFLVASGALARVNDARREHGQIAAFHNRTFDVTRVPPTVIMRNEDYGRIARILAGGTPVELEIDIVNRIYPEGRTQYNAIAEIPGTDKRDEVVMIGGHLDSWHAATGATDNAIGCAVMMEVVRTLQTLGVRPRRTIRVALWSGEEQGLLGSRAYVAEHFGQAESPKPDHSKLVAYLNLDSGTGRTRGANVFGPPAAAAVIREALKPFADVGVAGAYANRSRNTGGTDSTVFNNAGLPGINFVQDPIEYDSHTHHTNLDTYERVLESDVKSAAIVIAATVYRLAMRDEMLPRFSRSEMPAAASR